MSFLHCGLRLLSCIFNTEWLILSGMAIHKGADGLMNRWKSVALSKVEFLELFSV